MTAPHHRPVLQPTSSFEWIIGSDEAGAAQRLAQETSWALLDRVRSVADPEVVERVVRLASDGPGGSHRASELDAADAAHSAPGTREAEPGSAGVDDIAELWANSSPRTLAGQLWRIYLLRRIVHTDPEGSAELFRYGQALSRTIDPVVAGVADPIAPASIAALCDTILRGVFSGDLAIALERAASYCRVMSLGAAAIADERDRIDDAHAGELTTRALRYSSFANELHAGARRWRDGTLG